MYNNSWILRLLTATLHFNENHDHEQAKTKNEAKSSKISFPKQKEGAFTLKPVSIPKTYLKLHL